MNSPALGSRWRLADGSGAATVTVVRLELAFALCEYPDRASPNGGLQTQRQPLALWTHAGVSVVADDATALVVDTNALRYAAHAEEG